MIITLIANNILRRKGVNIYSTKNTWKIGLAFSPIVIVPICLSPDISIIGKAVTSIIMAVLGVLVIFAIRYGHIGYRKSFDILTAEDSRVIAADEKAKKEKEEKQKIRDRMSYGNQGPPPLIVHLRKNAEILVVSILIIAFTMVIMYSFNYPFNIVFSIFIIFIPILFGFLYYLRHRHKGEK